MARVLDTVRNTFASSRNFLPFLKRTSPSRSLNLTARHFNVTSMSTNGSAFSSNPIKARTPKPTDPFSPSNAFQILKNTLILCQSHEPSSPNFKVLPFRKGTPLAGTSVGPHTGAPNWYLGWLSLGECKDLLQKSELKLSENLLVYLGFQAEENVVYWAIDVSEAHGVETELGAKQFSFVELRTLMVATDWDNDRAMGDLAIAGHARALLEWHNISRFCGLCGGSTVPMEAGRHKQCSNELCKKEVYPRIDPVVIMLVIDRENDRALLSRQKSFVQRRWGCLAGFMEPGESLEEAVRRETREETGIEVGEVIYHSSQPWPVGPRSIPCQLMVGFFAYAKSLEINVNKDELEDAKWHNREEVRAALTSSEHREAQVSAAAKVEQMCKGVEENGHTSGWDMNAPMFIPGPLAIAHHLISSWANQVI